ncbi:hypothetical protein U9M48_040841, partial [Paspalum notatum var. saurae]
LARAVRQPATSARHAAHTPRTDPLPAPARGPHSRASASLVSLHAGPYRPHPAPPWARERGVRTDRGEGEKKREAGRKRERRGEEGARAGGRGDRNTSPSERGRAARPPRRGSPNPSSSVRPASPPPPRRREGPGSRPLPRGSVAAAPSRARSAWLTWSF